MLLIMILGSVSWFMFSKTEDSARPIDQLTQVAPPETPPGEKAVTAAPKQPPWTGETPLRCAGDERHALKGATIAGQGQLIRAAGKCQVTLEDCVIRSRSVRVEEGATVIITGGRLDSTPLRVEGEGRLILNGVDVLSNTQALRVMGTAQATLKKGSVTVQHAPALRVDDQARVSLTDVTVVGGIEGRDQSVVRIKGGSASEPAQRAEAAGRRPDAAIVVYGTAVVTLLNVAVTGPVKKHGGVVIELQPGDEVEAVIKTEQERAARQQRYERNGCRGFVACYSDNGSGGKVDVHIVMPIGPDGKAVGSSVRRALGANPKTRTCLQKLARERVIESFEGPPGALECRFSGMLQGGTQMLSFSVDYVPSAAPPATSPPPAAGDPADHGF